MDRRGSQCDGKRITQVAFVKCYATRLARNVALLMQCINKICCSVDDPSDRTMLVATKTLQDKLGGIHAARFFAQKNVRH